jgi:hypothetical protein
MVKPAWNETEHRHIDWLDDKAICPECLDIALKKPPGHIFVRKMPKEQFDALAKWVEEPAKVEPADYGRASIDPQWIQHLNERDTCVRNTERLRILQIYSEIYPRPRDRENPPEQREFYRRVESP